MKRIIIVHQWSGGPDKDFIPWLVNELKKSYEVIVPSMPNPDEPKIEPWLSTLRETLTEIRPDDVFVGHSVGCQTILRFLEKMPEGIKVNRVLMIAPWIKLTGLDEKGKQIAKPWLETPINFQEIKQKSDSFVAFFSKDDPYVPFNENSSFFKDKLGAEIIPFDTMGHFSEGDGVKKVPEILEYL